MAAPNCRSNRTRCAPASRRARRATTILVQRLGQLAVCQRAGVPLNSKWAQKVPRARPTTQPRLPRILPRPHLGEVDLKTLEASYPELSGVSAQCVRDRLVARGPEMLAAIANVRAVPPQNCLPRELEIVVSDMISADCPTHMLAVYSANSSQTCKVTLFPTHHLMLAAHCTKLPALPFSKSGTANAEATTLPVVPLCLPSAETFPILQSYLYTKRVDLLLAALLPAITSPFSTTSDPVSALAERLAQSGDLSSLGQHAMLINGLWKNACALGVHDKKFWGVIEVAWEAVVRAVMVVPQTTSSP